MPKQPLIPRANLMAFSLVTMLFLLWGIPNNMNDILIAQFMKSFELTRFQAVLVQSAFYLGYFTMAIPAGILMKKYSYKAGLILGLLLFALGCMLFWPAAVIDKYWLFLMALYVVASGLAFLETGSNSFVVELGAEDSAERRINLAQAFNSVGAILAVLIGTVFILSGIENNPAHIAALKSAGTYQDYLHHETMRVVTPYICVGCVCLLWAILMIATRFPKVRDELATEEGPKGRWQDLGNYPHFKWGVVSQFFYVGAQVGTWSFFMQYVRDYTGMAEKMAGYMLTGTLVAFALGRFTAAWFMRYIEPRKLMGLYAVVNIGLVGIAIAFPGQVGVWALFLTSFFMSLMFPTNYALAIRDLGPNTKIGGSFVIMSIIGAAALPPVMGLIFSQSHSMAVAEIVPLLAYGVIAWYAYKGSVLAPRIKIILA